MSQSFSRIGHPHTPVRLQTCVPLSASPDTHSRSPLSGGSQALLSLELVPLVNQVSLVAQMVKNLPAMWET